MVDVVYYIQKLFEDMNAVGFVSCLTPTECLTAAMNIPECKRAGMRINGPQQDTSEFLVHLIEHFYQKFRPLSDIFEGQLLTTKTCQRCSHSTINTKPFMIYTLQMDLPSMDEAQRYDLYMLMDYYHRPEIIPGYRCDYCSAEQSSERKVPIITPPKILVVALSRFHGLPKLMTSFTFLRILPSGTQ